MKQRSEPPSPSLTDSDSLSGDSFISSDTSSDSQFDDFIAEPMPGNTLFNTNSIASQQSQPQHSNPKTDEASTSFQPPKTTQKSHQ